MGSAPLQLKNKTLLLSYRLASRVDELAPLARAVNKALAEHADLAHTVNLCLEELIVNLIQHGPGGAADRQIQIRLSRSHDWLEVMLKDDAPPFDPFMATPAPALDAGVDARVIGGLGVHLVTSLMDDVRTFHDGRGNLIALFKALKH